MENMTDNELNKNILQVFRENKNIKMTMGEVAEYFIKNKQLSFGEPATYTEISLSVSFLYISGKIKKSVSNTGTYSRVIRYYFEEIPESGQAELF